MKNDGPVKAFVLGKVTMDVLPTEMLLAIVGYLGADDVVNVAFTSKRLFDVVQDRIPRLIGMAPCIGSLMYARASGHAWDQNIYLSGNLDCLKYASKEGCVPSNATRNRAFISARSVDIMRLVSGLKPESPLPKAVIAEACTQAIRNDKVDCLVYVMATFKVEGTRTLYREAIRHGSVKCLKHLCKGYKLGMDDTKVAVVAGHIKCLKFIRKASGWFHADVVCVWAAEHDQLKVLRYALPLFKLCAGFRDKSATVCLASKRSGSKRCLRYALANGCKDADATPEEEWWKLW